jgi:hypothetical protein
MPLSCDARRQKTTMPRSDKFRSEEPRFPCRPPFRSAPRSEDLRPASQSKNLQPAKDLLTSLGALVKKMGDPYMEGLYKQVCEKDLSPMVVVERKGGSHWSDPLEYITKKCQKSPEIFENYFPFPVQESMQSAFVSVGSGTMLVEGFCVVRNPKSESESGSGFIVVDPFGMWDDEDEAWDDEDEAWDIGETWEEDWDSNKIF